MSPDAKVLVCGRCGGRGRVYVPDWTGLDVDIEPCPECRPDVALPYAGTSGWSGSSTSEARAVLADADGTTKRRQHEAWLVVRDAGVRGVTWKELSQRLSLHHGSASGVLSVLHKVGRVARLAEARDRCKVYVSPEFIQGRETEPHGRKRPSSCPNCGCELGGVA